MDTYKTVKAQYENSKLRLKELTVLADQADHAWYMSGFDDGEEYKKMMETEKNAKDEHKHIRALAYELAVLEHKEFGTSLTKLFKEYGIAVASIRKLLTKNGVAYMSPTLMQWLPINSAPKDGTKFLALMRTSNIEIAFHTNGEYGGFRVDAYAPPMINEDWMEYWMPLPKPPALEGEKDD